MAERTRTRTRERPRPSSNVEVVQKSSGQVVNEAVSDPEVEIHEVGRAIRNGVGYVRISGSVTQNMGDFNSVRVGVEAELPCAPTLDALELTANELSAFVDRRLTQELDLAMNGGEQAPQGG